MSVKTFVAPNIQEAARRAKEELGKDAIILKVRPVAGKGLWRMTGHQRVELEACSPSDLQVQPRRRPPPSETGPLEPAASAQGRLTRTYGAAPAAPGGSEALQGFSARLDRILSLLQSQSQAVQPGRPSDVTEELGKFYDALVERRVQEATARGLIRQVNEALRGDELRNPVLLRAQLRKSLESMIRHSGPVALSPGRPRVVALVGPTGVGKTTTIAKLATHFHYVHRKKVGLVTIDTYRMGAKEQLQQYAEILGMPLAVALSSWELKRAVQEMADRDLILIDTAGYSQKDLLKLNEMRAFLSAARPDEVHLVLSCTTDAQVVRHILEVYKVLPVDRVLLTKLDEALAFGLVLDVMGACPHPFSYVTQGQKVTEDIRPGEPARMARLVLGEETP